MRTYLYQCKQCQETHERRHHPDETPLVACPTCQGLCERIPYMDPAVILRHPGEVPAAKELAKDPKANPHSDDKATDLSPDDPWGYHGCALCRHHLPHDHQKG